MGAALQRIWDLQLTVGIVRHVGVLEPSKYQRRSSPFDGGKKYRSVLDPWEESTMQNGGDSCQARRGHFWMTGAEQTHGRRRWPNR